MEVVVVPASRLAVVGAQLVADALRAAGRSAPTLMPALGTSALSVYRELGVLRAAGSLDTTTLRLVQLDEYLGVPGDDPRSLFDWLRRDVARPLGVGDERIVRLGTDGVPDDPDSDPAEAACRLYDRAVEAAGGIDVAVLGLGPNGHLGFNEPPSAP